MNAIKLYVSVARLILENDTFDQSVCTEINHTFPQLEQSLTCTVCRSILREPHSPTDTTCQHHVCKTCVGGRKRLKPSCSWCNDYSKYVKNTQLQCLLACYKALCNYVKHSNLLHQLNAVVPSSSSGISHIVQKGTELSLQNRGAEIKIESCDENESPSSNDLRHHLQRKRRESANLQNNHVFGNSSTENTSSNVPLDIPPRMRLKSESSRLSPSMESDKLLVNSASASTESHHPSRLRSGSDHSVSHVDKLSDSASDELTNPKTVYSVSFTGTRSKIILKRKHVSSRKDMTKKKEPSNHLEPHRLPSLLSIRSTQQSQRECQTSGTSRFRKISKAKPVANADRPSCRCGNATPKPGKLTCCGQRCACYMQSKACTGCRCRGCRNPHMIDGVKVLGRFTKDDSPEPNLITSNATSFQDLSANFLNEQISHVLPSSNTSVLNNS